MSWQALLSVGIGGFLGANARYVISWLANRRFGTAIAGTAFVNITGSFLLAMVTFWLLNRRGGQISDNLRLLIGTGFFGAYTTFSTYANESVNLLQNNWRNGIAYILLTNSLCLCGVLLGLWFANRIWG